MKKTLTLFLIIATCSVQAQRITDYTTRVGYQELRANGMLHIPLDTVLSPSANANPCQQIAKKNGRIYHYDCISGKWVAVASGIPGIDTVLSVQDTAYNKVLFFNANGVTTGGIYSTHGAGTARRATVLVGSNASTISLNNSLTASLSMNASDVTFTTGGSNTTLFDFNSATENILDFDNSSSNSIDLGTTGLNIRNSANTVVGKLFNDGRHQGAPAQNASEFIVRQQMTDSLNKRLASGTATLQSTTTAGDTTNRAIHIMGGIYPPNESADPNGRLSFYVGGPDGGTDANIRSTLNGQANGLIMSSSSHYVSTNYARFQVGGSNYLELESSPLNLIKVNTNVRFSANGSPGIGKVPMGTDAVGNWSWSAIPGRSLLQLESFDLVYEVTGTDDIIICGEATGSNYDLTVPTYGTEGITAGKTYTVRNYGTTSNVNLLASGGDTVEGSSSYVILPGKAVTIAKTPASGWIIIGGF